MGTVVPAVVEPVKTSNSELYHFVSKTEKPTSDESGALL
jgi:hypothetical protein